MGDYPPIQAQLAQLVEHLSCKQKVVDSTSTLGTIKRY